jgi:DNA-binding SARP family transcriptional activator
VARRSDVLGPLGVVIDGIDVTPRAPKERCLLAILVLHRDRVVDADTLIDELWPDLDVDRARRVLWVRIAGLRKCLDRAAAAGLLELASPGYRLRIDPDDVDARRFARLVADGRRDLDGGDRAAAASTLREALALWRGPPLADAQGCLLLEAEAQRLADARLDATEEWIEAELACGRHLHVLGSLDALVAEHPLRERLCRQRILALYRCGRAADALSACRELANRLVDEIGVEPEPELDQLERAIVARDPALLVPWPVRSPGSADALPARAERANRPRDNLPAPPDRFVGRARERERLAAMLAAHRLVTLTGPAGVGKKRLSL